MLQGRQWLPKTWGASSNAARRRCPEAPSILPKPLPPFIDAPEFVILKQATFMLLLLKVVRK